MVTLAKDVSAGISQTRLHRKAFYDVDAMPWLDWVMEGTWFKLLNINPISGGFTMLLKVSPNNTAPIHGHIGSVEGIVLEGGFGYGEDRGRAGCYVREPGGINHLPDTDSDGMVMFATVNGPLAGYNPDGSIAAIVDAKLMYEMAAAGNCASHIDRPIDW